MIELVWGKKRILEVYLNVAETGKGYLELKPRRRHILTSPQKNYGKKKRR